MSEEQNTQAAKPSELSALLGATHAGMKISASGILGSISAGSYYNGLDYGFGVMLNHLQQMADRFYAGDAKAVDEFLQLYCLDDKLPETPNAQTQPPFGRSEAEAKRSAGVPC